MPSTSSTIRVDPPLQATRRQRVARTSRASASVAAASAASPGDTGCAASPGAGIGLGEIDSAIGEPVAHAADRLDPAARVTELRPEVVHVRVDGVWCHRDGEGPGLIEQLIA